MDDVLANLFLEIPGIPDFWNRLRNASSRFLALDYDGTLAPFAINPMAAKPLPGVASLIRKLAIEGHTSVAIISGRPANELMTLLDNPPVAIVGCHGHEIWPLDGTRIVREPTPEQRLGLDMIETNLKHRGQGLSLEVKTASLAMHTRGRDPVSAIALEQEVLAEWGGVAIQHGLECRLFNGGIEIRCAGWNKGKALDELLSLQPADVFTVYIGDDETDEDAFALLRHRGIAIKVGDASVPTVAQSNLPDCFAVANFLRLWAALTIPEKKGK